uniref:Uncharacterized protein n=1 Tax=Rhodopseudomonas palustris (strain BisA53) TaxID=316055 RepID=Q07NR9_RHOP5
MTGRPSIVPTILDKLDPYLDKLAAAWAHQPEHNRLPTLPTTSDGKVNVRALVRELGLKETDEQHFYRKTELSGPVNAIAAEQGLRGIGSRLREDELFAGVRVIVGRKAAEMSDLRRTLSEREALISSLRAENAALRAKLALIEATGMLFRDPETT